MYVSDLNTCWFCSAEKSHSLVESWPSECLTFLFLEGDPKWMRESVYYVLYLSGLSVFNVHSYCLHNKFSYHFSAENNYTGAASPLFHSLRARETGIHEWNHCAAPKRERETISKILIWKRVWARHISVSQERGRMRSRWKNLQTQPVYKRESL